MTGVREGDDIYKGCEPKPLYAAVVVGVAMTICIIIVAILMFTVSEVTPPSPASEATLQTTDGCKDANNVSEAVVSLEEAAASILYIPTVKELQQALCAAGYPVEVDCVVGKETKQQWDRYRADRMAAKFMTRSGRPK